MNDEIPVTVHAKTSGHPDLPVMSAHGARRVRHVFPMPTGLCPRTGNPKSGTFELEYDVVGDRVLEVVALHRFIATAHKGKDAPRSSEGWARKVADAAAKALGGPVSYRMTIGVVPEQTLIVEGVAG